MSRPDAKSKTSPETANVSFIEMLSGVRPTSEVEERLLSFEIKRRTFVLWVWLCTRLLSLGILGFVVVNRFMFAITHAHDKPSWIISLLAFGILLLSIPTIDPRKDN